VGVDESVESEVLDTLIVENLGSSLEPWDVSSVGRPLWNDASQSSEHSPTSVDQLKLSVTGKGLWISRETGGIPSVVSWELTGEVWHIWGEWTEVLWTVWTIPADVKKLKQCYSLIIKGMLQARAWAHVSDWHP
jgi:hypothetical protein